LLSITCGNKCFIYNTQGEKLQTINNHIKDVICCGFSPNGKLFITSAKDGSASIWSTTTWKVLHCLEGHSDEVTWAQFSFNNEMAVTAGHDNMVIIWNVNTGEIIQS